MEHLCPGTQNVVLVRLKARKYKKRQELHREMERLTSSIDASDAVVVSLNYPAHTTHPGSFGATATKQITWGLSLAI